MDTVKKTERATPSKANPRTHSCNNSEDGDECPPAEHFCTDCCEYYCKTCSKGHRRSNATRSHMQVSIDDVTEEIIREARAKSETPRCPKHKDEKLKLYCKSCQCAVCSVCCHISHQSHTFKEMADVDVELKAELEAHIAQLQSLSDGVEQQSEQIKTSQEKLEANTSSARTTTENTFKELIQMLNQRAKELDQSLKKKAEDGRIEAAVHNKNLTLRGDLLGSLETFADDLLNKGTVYNRLVSLPEIRNRLQELQTHPLLSEGGTSFGNIPSSAYLIEQSLNGHSFEKDIKLRKPGSSRVTCLKIKLTCSIGEGNQKSMARGARISFEFDKIAASADKEETHRLKNGENQQRQGEGNGKQRHGQSEGNRARSHESRGAFARMNVSSSSEEREVETRLAQWQKSFPPLSSLPITGPSSEGAVHFETNRNQQVGDQLWARERSGRRHDYSGDTSGSTHNTQHESHVYSFLPDANIYKSTVGDHTVMIYRKDITRTDVEAIVNAPDSGSLENIGAVGRAIGAATGSCLERECQDVMKYRSVLRETEVQATRGGTLCKFVLHVVGPTAQYTHSVYGGANNNLKHSLENTFLNCLRKAETLKVRSIAVPAIGSGLNRYPESFVGEALCEAVGQFCKARPTGTGGTLREIHLVDIDEKRTKETNSQFKQSPLFRELTGQSADTSRHTNTSVASTRRTPDHDNWGRRTPGGAEQQRLSSSGEENADYCLTCLDTLQGKKTKLLNCGHEFCVDCIDEVLKMRNVCPLCGASCSKITGNQPQNGKMTSARWTMPLPGYEKCGSITIYYSFRDGIQGPSHPNPGKRYHGTRQTAYLPDNKEGRDVLKLLEKAFDARLIFTIGQSVTTGMNDQVAWNDIRHKTSTQGGSFGYPDSTYLQRVKEELAAKGIR